MKTVADQVLRGARWLALGRVITPLATVVMSLMTIRLLEPADLGVFALVSAVASFFILFEDFGLRAKVIQTPEIDVASLARIFGLSLMISLGLAFVLAGMSPLIAAAYEEPRVVPLLITLSAVMLVGAFGGISDACLKRQLRFGTVTLIDFAQGIVTATTGLALAWSGAGVWSLVVAMAAGTVVRTLAVTLVSPFRLRPDFHLRGALASLGFGGFVAGQRLLFWFYTRVDRLALGRLAGTEALGLYAVAADVANMPADRLGGLIGLTTFAGLSRVADQPETFRRYYLNGVRLIAVVLFPVGFGLAAVLSDLLPLVLGAQWVAAVPIAQVLALVVPLRLINGTIAESLNALGRTREALACVATVALLTSLGALIGVLSGPFGAAVGWAVAFPFGFLVNARFNLRQIGVGPGVLFVTIAPAACAAAVMVLVVVQGRVLLASTGMPVPVLLVCQIALGVVSYILAVAVADRHGLRLLRGLTGGRRG